jgi:hypothetical protein
VDVSADLIARQAQAICRAATERARWPLAYPKARRSVDMASLLRNSALTS